MAVSIAVTDHAEGCVVPVWAQPRARRAGVQGEQAGVLKVSVTAPPEDGRANKAFIEELRKALSVKRSQVELLVGRTSRHKRFLIRGLTRAELEARITKLLSE